MVMDTVEMVLEERVELATHVLVTPMDLSLNDSPTHFLLLGERKGRIYVEAVARLVAMITSHHQPNNRVNWYPT